MKISKRQLRNIVREATSKLQRKQINFGSNSFQQNILKESYMSRLFDEIQNWVLDFNETGVVHVDDLISAWKVDYPDIAIDQLWGAIETMEESGLLQSEGSSGYFRFL